MIFEGCSFGEFMGMIFFFPFVIYLLLQLFEGLSEGIIFYFRYKDFY